MTDTTGRPFRNESEGMSGTISPSTATPQHQASAPRRVRVAVVTISDTRTAENDESGSYLRQVLEQGGHDVAEYLIVPDDAMQIRSALVRLLREVDLILTTGGTGIAGRDVTIGVVESLLVKTIPGFGELFRTLSYEQVRGAAMLSRATGGLTRGALLFALPGSLNAVQTAWEGILHDQIGHLVFEVARQGQPDSLPKPETLDPEGVRTPLFATSGQATAVHNVTDKMVFTTQTGVTVGSEGQQASTELPHQGSAGLGRHAGVSAAPSTVGTAMTAENSEAPRTTNPGLGRHAAGRNDRRDS